MGWDMWNLIETIGAFAMAFSILIFIWNVSSACAPASWPATTRGTPRRWSGRPLAAAGV